MEAGKKAGRRLGATSTTTTTANDDEASKRLLTDNREGHHRDIPNHHLSRPRDSKCEDCGDGSRWLRPLGLLFLAFVLATMIISSATCALAPSPYVTSATFGGSYELEHDRKTLGIRLHPEHYTSRAPKTIIRDWYISSGWRSPDGVRKQVYLVNGQFPGPTIECRSGDHLIIHVTNVLADEGVSIHWHGLHMREKNSMDGAVGFTQCPIASGETFTYEFDVDEDQSGTFWWHAHSHVQRGDGLYGGLVVHSPNGATKMGKAAGSSEEILLMIGDWYHRSSEEVLSWYMSTRGFGNEPVPDSLVVNGVGKFICSMAVPARPVNCTDILDEDILPILLEDQQADAIRLRVVNTGSLTGFTFGVSTGTLTPLAVDGDFPIKTKASTSVGVLYPGERMDVLLHADNVGDNKPSLFHIGLDPENFKYPNSALRPNQTFPLTAGAQNFDDKADEPENEDPKHFDLALASGLMSDPQQTLLSEEPHQIVLLHTKTEKLAKLSNHPTGFINRTSWAAQSDPLLPLIALPRSQWDSNQLVPWIASSHRFVEIIVNNLDDGAHPFHLHGNDFYVIASHRSDHGWGSYSPYETSGSSSIPPALNLENPVRKDTVSVPRRGYVILRFRPSNPGIWMFHCHVLFHQASGMAMGLAVGGAEEHEEVDLSTKSLCG